MYMLLYQVTDKTFYKFINCGLLQSTAFHSPKLHILYEMPVLHEDLFGGHEEDLSEEDWR